MVWCVCVPDSVKFVTSSVKAVCFDCSPKTWAEKYPQAAGHRQSPIDISSSDVNVDPKLSRTPLRWIYPSRTEEIVNTGYCWKAHVQGENSVLQGGPLQDQYKLEQFHCHWGKDETCGSEHTVDGQAYAAELHFVHWNTKYGSFTEALKYGDGLAVLGVFLEVGKEHSELAKLVQVLDDIPYKDDVVTLKESLDPARLLPENKAYWTYLGSLTTPPCNECVTWIVFKDSIQVSQKQLEAFRNMHFAPRDYVYQNNNNENTKMINNYRSPLPKGDRTIRLSYI